MKSLFTKLIATCLCGIVLLLPIFAGTVHATSICDIPCTGDDAAACEEIKAANGCTTSSDTPNDLSTTVTNILYAIIGISGLVAVVFIIIGGITYITSAGDAAKLKKAKDTILYALVGVVVCVLAFAIVNWVVSSLKDSTQSFQSNKDEIASIFISNGNHFSDQA